MSTNGHGETTSKERREKPQAEFVGLLHAAARIAVLCGAVGSVAFLFHASQRRPPILMAIFVVWVLYPFIALLLADSVSKHWRDRLAAQ